jgi:hypothetical protein
MVGYVQTPDLFKKEKVILYFDFESGQDLCPFSVVFDLLHEI